MGKKSTRFFARWRLDQDYVSRLSPGDRAWLEKFNGEYYRCEFEGEALHATGERRRELYRAQNSAERDVVTASSTVVLEAVTQFVSDRPSLRSRFYSPADYRAASPSSGPEDELVDLLEEVRSRLGYEADIVDLFSEVLRLRRTG